MRISTPLTSRARKHKVVIQCVTRTRAECRAVTVLAGTASAEVAAQAASLIRECYQVARTLRKPTLMPNPHNREVSRSVAGEPSPLKIDRLAVETGTQ